MSLYIFIQFNPCYRMFNTSELYLCCVHSQATCEQLQQLWSYLWSRKHICSWPQQYNIALTLITHQNCCMGFFGNRRNPCNHLWDFGIGQMLKPCITSGTWTWNTMSSTPLCYHLSKCLHLLLWDTVRSLNTYSVYIISMWGI